MGLAMGTELHKRAIIEAQPLPRRPYVRLVRRMGGITCGESATQSATASRRRNVARSGGGVGFREFVRGGRSRVPTKGRGFMTRGGVTLDLPLW